MLDFLRNRGKSEHGWVEESLSAYIDRELSARDVARVEKHLQECQACGENLATLQRTVALLRELPAIPAPRSFAIRPAPVRRKARVVTPGWGYGLLKGATALAALLLVLLIGGDLTLQFLGGFRLAAPAPMAPAAEVALAPSAVPSITPPETEEELMDTAGKMTETPTTEVPPSNMEEPLAPAAAATEAPEAYQVPPPQDTAGHASERTEGAQETGTPTPLATPVGTPVPEDQDIGAGDAEPTGVPTPLAAREEEAGEGAEVSATPTPTATPEVVAMADVAGEEVEARDEAHVQAETSLLSPLRVAELVVFIILLALIPATLLTGWLIRKRSS